MTSGTCDVKGGRGPSLHKGRKALLPLPTLSRHGEPNLVLDPPLRSRTDSPPPRRGASPSQGCKRLAPPGGGEGGSPRPPRGRGTPPAPLRGQAQHRRSQTPHPLPVFCLHSGKPSRLAKMCRPPPGDVVCLPWIRTFVDSRGAHGGGRGQKKNISCVCCSFLDLKTLK